MWKLYRHLGLHGKAVKLAVKQLDEKQTKENEKILVDLLKCLGWDHVVRCVCNVKLIFIFDKSKN